MSAKGPPRTSLDLGEHGKGRAARAPASAQACLRQVKGQNADSSACTMRLSSSKVCAAMAVRKGRTGILLGITDLTESIKDKIVVISCRPV